MSSTTTITHPDGTTISVKTAAEEAPARPPLAFADRVMPLKNEGAYAMLDKVNARLAKGLPVVNLCIGQPDRPTPALVVEAARKELAEGNTKYSDPQGDAELREATAAYMNERGNGGVPVEAGNIVIGPGCKPGLFNGIMATVQAGDEVLCPDPGFPSYDNAIMVAGAKVVSVPLSPECDAFDIPALKAAITPRSRLIIVNSPSNPTGGVMTAEHLAEIAAICLEHKIWILSDEIYSRLNYTGEKYVPSMLDIPSIREQLILIDGCSKTWCMTGWRLGWAVMPRALAERVKLLCVHSYGCVNSFVQAAAIPALQGKCDETVKELVAEYQARRDFVCSELNKIEGVRCPVPGGAFYAFPDVSSYGVPTSEMADMMLANGVAVLPGEDFGPNAQGFLRLSTASNMEQLTAGLECIKLTLEQIRSGSAAKK